MASRSEVKSMYERWQALVRELRRGELTPSERESIKGDAERAKNSFLSLLPAFLACGDLTFSEYQKEIAELVGYPGKGSNYLYPVLGLCSEAGEVAEKVKKVIRDNGGRMTGTVRAEIIRKLGDALLCLSQIAKEFDTSLTEVARLNVDALASEAEIKSLRDKES